MGEMADYALDCMMDEDEAYQALDYRGGPLPPGYDTPEDLPSNPFRKESAAMAQVTRQKTKPAPRPVASKGPPKPVAKKPTSSPKKTDGSPAGYLGMPPFAFVCYGPSGVGKTSFAAHFPKPGFIIDPQEQGIRDLVAFKQCPEPVWTEETDNFSDLIDQCDKIATGKTGIQTAVFDSLTGLEQLCFAHHCEEYFEGDWSSKGFYSFQQGPKNAAKTDWPKFLDALDRIRVAGVNVLVLAHSTVKNFSNPEGADYERFVCALDKEIWHKTHRWAQAIFFYNFFVEVEKKGPKSKANQESQQRFLYSEWSPAFDAKNRFGMDPIIEAGESGESAYEAFKDAYTKAAKGRR